MTNGGIKGSIQSIRELPDNPVALLLQRQQRGSIDRQRGWLARPMFLFLAFLLMLLTCAFILRQFWMLSQMPEGTVHPLYVTSARHVAVNSVLWYTGLLSMLYSISLALSGFQHGVLLLSPRAERGSGMRLDDMLRSAPLDTTGVINGLLYFHLSQVMRALWVPLALLALLTGIIIADGHIDSGSWQPFWDWMYVISIPALAMLLSLFLASIVVITGVAMGMYIRWPLLSHLLFGVSCTFWALLLLGFMSAAKMAFGAGYTTQLSGSIGKASIAMLMLVFMLLFVVNRRLAFNAIERRQRAGEVSDTQQENAATAGMQNHSGWRITDLVVRVALVAIPVFCALALIVHTAGLKYDLIDTGNPLYDWYQQYVLELSLEGKDSGPVRGYPFWFLTQRQPVYYNNSIGLEPERIASADGQFADDPRWPLLKFELIGRSYYPYGYGRSLRGDPALRRNPQELAMEYLGEAGDSAAASPVLEFHALRLQLEKTREALFREITRKDSESGPDEDLVSELEAEIELLHAALVRLAEDSNEAYPVYWLAANLMKTQPERALELMQIGNRLDCSSNFQPFVQKFIYTVSDDPHVEDRHILAAMHGNISGYSRLGMGSMLSSDFRILGYVQECANSGNLEGLDAALRMLNRLCLNTDSDHNLVYMFQNVVRDSMYLLRASPATSQEQKRELGTYDMKLMALLATLKLNPNGGFSSGWSRTLGKVQYVPFANMPYRFQEDLMHAEDVLSMGHWSMISFADYNMTSDFIEAIKHKRWLRQHRDDLAEFLDFSFETLSWEEPVPVIPLR